MDSWHTLHPPDHRKFSIELAPSTSVAASSAGRYFDVDVIACCISCNKLDRLSDHPEEKK